MSKLGVLFFVLFCNSCSSFELIYNRDGEIIRWEDRVIPYNFDGAVPRFVKKAFEAKMREWEAASGGAIQFKKVKKSNFSMKGGGLYIRYWRGGWINDFNTLGYSTYSTFTPKTVRTWGIIINAHSFKWHVGDPFFTKKVGRKKQTADINRVAVHELGHILGLNHSDDPQSVMKVPIHEGRGAISDDDIAGIQFLYPVSPKPQEQ